MALFENTLTESDRGEWLATRGNVNVNVTFHFALYNDLNTGPTLSRQVSFKQNIYWIKQTKALCDCITELH